MILDKDLIFLVGLSSVRKFLQPPPLVFYCCDYLRELEKQRGACSFYSSGPYAVGSVWDGLMWL